MLGGHYKQQNHQQKVQNVVLNRLWKEHLFIVWELKQESRVSPCETSVGNKHVEWFKVVEVLGMSANEPESAMSIDSEVTNKFQWTDKFTI